MHSRFVVCLLVGLVLAACGPAAVPTGAPGAGSGREGISAPATSAPTAPATRTPTLIPSPTATWTALPPTATSTPVPTDTPVPPTATKTAPPPPVVRPTATFTPVPPPPSPPTPTPVPASGVNGNPWGYNWSCCNLIYSPPSNFCSYFACIGNFWNGVGYVIQCKDGMFSKSGGRSGSCSSHGGNGQPLYAP